MDMPPRGTHVWRQCITMAVARNFYQEDMNILRPRVDRREDTDGVTGMQFPSYEYLVAVGYNLVGERNWVPRLVQFLLFALSIWGLYRLVQLLTGRHRLAAFAAWLFSWSPEMFYHGINALPDVLALGASIWGFYFLIRFTRQGRLLNLVLGSGFLILSGATKIQYLAVGGGILVAWLLELKKKGFKSRDLLFLLTGVAIVVISSSWYLYAAELTKTSGLAEFGLHVRSFPSISEALRILRVNLQMDVPETLLGFGTFGTFVIGVYHLISGKKWNTELGLIMSGWFAVLLIYHLLDLSQMEHHQYYMMPHIPIMIIVAAYGLSKLANTKWKPLAILVLAAAPILAGIRIIPARWADRLQVNESLYNEQTRNEIIEHIPQDALVITGGDPSNCIYLYFLEAKGFCFSNDNPLNQPLADQESRIENYISRGAEVLVSDKSAAELGIEEWIESESAALHGFWVYQLKRAS